MQKITDPNVELSHVANGAVNLENIQGTLEFKINVDRNEGQP